MITRSVVALVASALVWESAGHARQAALSRIARPSASRRRQVPLGHPDFYPSHERPIGWRGDGTGAWPGARVVSRWDAATGTNIVWRSEMPGAGFSQPVVVGEKVITTADPNLLVCANVHTGRILWQVAVDHTEAMPASMQRAARAEIAFFADRWRDYAMWRKAVVELEALVRAEGLNTRGLWLDIKQHKILASPDRSKEKAEHGKILADAELKKKYERLKRWQDDNGFAVLTACNGQLVRKSNSDKLRGQPQPPLRERWLKAQLAYDLWFADNWEGYTTWSFATPCTDGEHVYVTTVNNAVACYDLDGKKKWLVWDHPKNNRDTGPLHTRFVPSPLLVGDRLVVNQNGELRAFDKRTGRKLWGIVNPYGLGRKKRPSPNRPCRPTPEGCSPAHARLPLKSGGTLDVIVDAAGKIYRLADGKVVGSGLPYMGKGASPACVGDLYVWKTGHDGRPSKAGAVKMMARSRDVVNVEPVWEKRSKCKGSFTNAVLNGTVYLSPSKSGSEVFDLATGATRTLTRSRITVNRCSPIVAGDKLCVPACGDFWDKRSGKPLGSMKTTVVDLTTGSCVANNNAFVDKRVFGDDEFALRYRYVGCGRMISNASPSAQANRLFFRTKGYLWCVGDPSQRFPVPRDCPPQGRAR